MKNSNIINALKDFLEEKRRGGAFSEYEVKALLRQSGFPVPKGIFISGETPPLSLGLKLSALSYPLAAKVSSSKIVSKSEVKGVRLGLRNEGEMKKAVKELLKIKDAEGVIIEEMAQEGLEVIIGGTIDMQFGPIVMFGLGGVYVELFKDIAFALAPLKKADAQRLVRQVKGYRILQGYRGRPPVDMEILLDMIIKVSEFISSRLIKEIDLNPVALYPKGAMVLDAKMTAVQYPL